MPSGTEVHIGVYDFHERQHAQLQQRRNDLVSLLMYLTERRLFFSINHVFSSVTGRARARRFRVVRESISRRSKRATATCSKARTTMPPLWRSNGTRSRIGGSDAHALASVGTAYTEVPGARDKEEFFDGLRNGAGRVAGESGSFSKLTRDVFSIAFEMMREKSWTTLLAPLALLVPAFTFLNYYDESVSAAAGRRRFSISPRPQASSLDLRAATGGGGIDMTVAKAVWNQIQSNDHRLMRRVHRWRAPRWFRILMIVATRGGDGWLWYALGI